MGAATVVVNGTQLFTAVSSPKGPKTEQFEQGNKLLYNTPGWVASSSCLRRVTGVGIAVLFTSGGMMLLVRRAAGQPAP